MLREFSVPRRAGHGSEKPFDGRLDPESDPFGHNPHFMTVGINKGVPHGIARYTVDRFRHFLKIAFTRISAEHEITIEIVRKVYVGAPFC